MPFEFTISLYFYLLRTFIIFNVVLFRSVQHIFFIFLPRACKLKLSLRRIKSYAAKWRNVTLHNTFALCLCFFFLFDIWSLWEKSKVQFQTKFTRGNSDHHVVLSLSLSLSVRLKPIYLFDSCFRVYSLHFVGDSRHFCWKNFYWRKKKEEKYDSQAFLSPQCANDNSSFLPRCICICVWTIQLHGFAEQIFAFDTTTHPSVLAACY